MADESVKLKWSKGAGTVELVAGKLFVGSIIPLSTNFPEHSKLVFFANNGKFENDQPVVQTTKVDANGSCEIDLCAELLRSFFMVQPQGGSAIFTAYLYLADDATTTALETDKSLVLARGQITIHYTPITFREARNGIIVSNVAVSLKGEKGEKGDTGYSIIGPAAKLGYVHEHTEDKWYPLSCERQEDGSLLLVVDDEETPESEVAPVPDGDIQNLRGIIEGQNTRINTALQTYLTDDLSYLKVNLQDQNTTLQSAITAQNEAIAQAKDEQDESIASQNATIQDFGSSYVSSINALDEKIETVKSRLATFNESMTDGITNGFIYPLCDDLRVFQIDTRMFIWTFPRVGDYAPNGRRDNSVIYNSIQTQDYIEDSARWEFKLGGQYYSRDTWLTTYKNAVAWRSSSENPYNTSLVPYWSIKNRKNLLIRFDFKFRSRSSSRQYHIEVGYYDPERDEDVIFFVKDNCGSGTTNDELYRTQVILPFSTGDTLPTFFVVGNDMDTTKTTWQNFYFHVYYSCYQYVPLI